MGRYAGDTARGISARDYDLTTPQGRLKYLGDLIEAVPASTQAKLVEQIGETANQMGAGVGPSPPRTDEEIEDRIAIMVEPFPRKLVERAFKKAFRMALTRGKAQGEQEL